MTQELVTYQLVGTKATSYQRSDGTFIDNPVSATIMREFTIYSNGKPVKYRHIRNASSILLDDQVSKKEEPNLMLDNLYFNNGLAIFDSLKDQNAIEFMDISPQNEANPTSGVEPFFKKVTRAEDGQTEMEVLLLKNEATKLVLKLQEKKDNTFVYNENKINFLANIFNLDGDLELSEKILQLHKKAETEPSAFIYRVNSKTSKFEKEIEDAIDLSIIKIEKGNAFLTSTNTIIIGLEKVKKENEKSMLVEFYSNPQNEIEYQQLLSLLNESKENKQNLKTK